MFCKECGKETVDNATLCPDCQDKENMSNMIKEQSKKAGVKLSVLGLVFGILSFVLVLVASFTSGMYLGFAEMSGQLNADGIAMMKACLEATHVLGIISLVATIPCYPVAIIGIVKFAKKPAEGYARPVKAFVLGLVGLFLAIMTVFNYLSVAAMLVI